MTDPHVREERIAIRQFCGDMTEREAIRLADAEVPSPAQRIAVMAQHQREHTKPVPLHTPRHEPILDRKSISAGSAA
jgi:hypothetical protein